MISILKHIQFLILTQDCVVIPGLGAFVSRYLPARLSDDGYVMYPPSRELSFNSSLVHDDGMLTGSITRREGISYDCARIAVEQEVELILRRLRHEGKLAMPRIGELTLASHGAIEFTPEKSDAIVTLPFSGFSRLNLTPVVELEEPIAEEISIPDVEILPLPVKRHRSVAMTALKYAASAAVLVGVCLTMLTPISPKEMDFASLQPVVRTESPSLQKDEAQYADREIRLFRPDPAEATAEVAPRPDRYYVIVASSNYLKEAQKYVRLHSTSKYPLQILPSDGRYRVFAASGNDFDEMAAFRTADPDFAAANPNVWIYTLR